MKIDRRGLLHAVAARRWAMEAQALAAGAELFINTHIASAPQASVDAPWKDENGNIHTEGYYVVEGIAVLELTGLMLKNVPRSYPDDASSTHWARNYLYMALSDPSVRAIYLLIDSPGGEVSGVQELGDALFAARSVKPIHAHISDQGCSAALWIAAQAGTISANRTARVGSIGVYAVLEDWSEAFAEAGIKVHVLSSAPPLKGAGVPGTEITDEQMKPIREEIDALSEEFIRAVARGRSMSAETAKSLATGRVWLAEEALKLNLIDQVENSDEALARFAASTQPANPGRVIMPGASSAEGGDAMRFSLFGRKKPAAEPAPTDAAKPEAVKPAAVVEDIKPEKTPEASAAKLKDADGVEVEVEAAASLEAAPIKSLVVGAMTDADVMALSPVIGAEKAVAARAAGKSREQALTEEIAALRETVASQKTVIEKEELLGSQSALAITPPDGKPAAGAKADQSPIAQFASKLKFRAE